MKARSPVKFMDVCDMKVTEEHGFLAGHHHEGTNLDPLCDRRNCVPAFASGHWSSVALVKSSNCISNFTSEMLLMEHGHLGNFLFTWS